jgi:hypothetical protein
MHKRILHPHLPRTDEPTGELCEALLHGATPSGPTSSGLERVSPLLSALTAEPEEADLRGYRTVESAYRHHLQPPPPRRSRRFAMVFTLAGTKLGATLAGVAVGLGATAVVVALNVSSPVAPAGRPVVDLTGTPAASASSTTTDDPTTDDPTTDDPTSTEPAPSGPSSAVGPDAGGAAAFGLCTAWSHVTASGTQAEKSVAFRNLVAAAGGSDNVAAYCAAVEHPGQGATKSPATHPTGKPSAVPTGRPSTHPSGKPSTHPTGKPL